MSHNQKLLIPALAALGLFAFMSVEAGAVKHEFSQIGGSEADTSGDASEGDENGDTPAGGNSDEDKNGSGVDKNGAGKTIGNGDQNGIMRSHENSGGNGVDDKNGGGVDKNGGGGVTGIYYGGGGGMGGWNQYNRRGIACYNGYRVVMVRNIRDCGVRLQRRVAVGGGGARSDYNYGGGLIATKNGGGYAYGGGYGYPQPVIRYYKPASNAAVMQAEKRARRAAQYNYGGGYGYDNRGYGGGYALNYGAGYNMQMGYGGSRHNVKRSHRKHRGQAYGMMGGNGGGYVYGGGYDAGYGAGFGYGGTTIHYGPVMTKDGGY